MKIVIVNKENYEQYKYDYIELYKEIFSKAPYFEIFTDKEAEEVYQLSLLNSTISLLAIKDNKIIGFALGIQLSIHNDEKFKTLISEYFNLDKVLYNAELGVLPKYRGLGIGSKLVEKRVLFAKDMGYETICMRTKKKGSMSISLYQKLGFKILEGVEEISTTKKNILLNELDVRIILYKNLITNHLPTAQKL